MKAIELLLAYFAKALNMREDEVSELLTTKSEDGESVSIKEDALNTLLSRDKERVERLKRVSKEAKTGIYNKAYAEAKDSVLSDVEKKYVAKYDLPEGLKMDEIIEKVASAASSNSGDDLTDDAIKKHPLYLALENKTSTQAEELAADFEQRLQNYKTERQQDDYRSNARTLALSYAQQVKPVWSTDAERALRQQQDFQNRFDEYQYQPHGENDFLVLDKEGKRIDDGHGNGLLLSNFAKQKAASLYDTAKQDPKGNPGNENTEGSSIVEVPKDQEAFSKAYLEAQTPDERRALHKAYSAAGGTLD